MKKDDKSPAKEDSSDLVKFKRLAMRVVAIPKDAIYGLGLETAHHKAPTKKAKGRKPPTKA